MLVSFERIQLGAGFKQNGAEFIKTSTRTARLLENPHRVFYFSKSELVPFKDVKTLTQTIEGT